MQEAERMTVCNLEVRRKGGKVRAWRYQGPDYERMYNIE